MVLLEMTMNFFCCTKEVSLFSPTEWFLRFWFVLESRLISGEIFKMSEVSVILEFSSQLKMIVHFPPQKVFLDSRWIFFWHWLPKIGPKISIIVWKSLFTIDCCGHAPEWIEWAACCAVWGLSKILLSCNSHFVDFVAAKSLLHQTNC